MRESWRMLARLCLSFFMCALAVSVRLSAAEHLPTFKKIHPTDKFWAEGAHFADFNRDGNMDVVYGPFWFEGPQFQKSHEFYPANASFKRKKADGSEEIVAGFEGALGINNAYSDNFLTFTYDFNGDGWPDVLV